MATLRFNLHPAQDVIWQSNARFKVVAAGRRFGKTVLAVMKCIVEGFKEEDNHGRPLNPNAEVIYFGTTLEQARRNAWNLFKGFARPVAKQIYENTAVIILSNGVRIRLLGMDSPDAARGLAIRYAVLDEYADMPEQAWPEIIRPALMDSRGGALFIGTPKGKNHFYHLFTKALADGKEWEAFNFASADNPTLDPTELADVAEEYSRGSEELHRQEIEARFISKGGQLFHRDDFKIGDEPTNMYGVGAPGDYYIAVDLAGFTTEAGKRNSEIKKRDETAISIVKVYEDGNWWVKEIQHGRWDVRETAFRIVKAAADNSCISVGIEKGALANAVEPYIREYQSEYNRWINVIPLTHGNRHKTDRIQWALQGRAQKGRLTLNPGPWNEILIEQAIDFPSRLTHDDLLDSLAYIDQMAEVLYHYDEEQLPREYVPLDEISGF